MNKKQTIDWDMLISRLALSWIIGMPFVCAMLIGNATNANTNIVVDIILWTIIVLWYIISTCGSIAMSREEE